MLKHLSIHNYVLIASLELDWSEGFTTITGETGAGKSILLGALGLVMGGKADAHTITDGADKCVIEATFSHQGEEMIIRRELNRNGRSRSFVNDEVISMPDLRKLSSELIDIHSQHRNLLLTDNLFQLSVVDAFAHDETQRQAYAIAYQAWTDANDALRALKAQAAKAQQDADYNLFRLSQLEEAHLSDDDELETLQAEEYTLSHAEQIRQTMQQAAAIIEDSEPSALSMLEQIKLDDNALSQRLESVCIELSDIARECAHQASIIEPDEGRLASVQQRIDMLQTLLHKFRCNTIYDLIAERDALRTLSNDLSTFDERIEELTQRVTTATQTLQRAAENLTKARRAVTQPMAEELTANLKELGIAHARMAIDVSDTNEFQETGKDYIQFLFSANLGQSLQPAADIASGGEMARIMLCIKALTAQSTALPTLIFDEIDTGVSGNTALRMGEIMQRMAQGRQVIAITHLPQIAALGTHHLEVYKQDEQGHTQTHIRTLTPEQRVNAIATLLSGSKVTDAALTTAKQLMQWT